MTNHELLRRLETRSLELSRASATDERDRYMNVIARLSREDGELMRLAAAAIRQGNPNETEQGNG